MFLARFFVDVVFGFCVFSFLRDKAQVVTGHPHTHLFLSVFVLFFVPPRLVFRLFWACVLLLGVFSGCHFGPRAFLGFSWNLRGLSSLAPSEARFWTRGGKGVSVFFARGFCFSPSVSFCGHAFLDNPSR